MAKKWYVGYFYHGYLNQLMAAFKKKKELSEVDVWYPQTCEVVVKDGKKMVITAPMFDNYIFFEFEETSYIWKDIIKLTPIISFLKDEYSNRPVAITDEEIQHMRDLECTNKTVDYSCLINRKVVVINGPFANFTGTCKSIIKNKYKARVMIEMFGMIERNVEINLEDLELFEGGEL